MSSLKICLITAAACIASPAFGDSDPYPGIHHIVSAGEGGGGSYHAVTIDLTRYRIVQSSPSQYARYAAGFATATDSLVVINSNYGPLPTSVGNGGPSCGLSVGDGQIDSHAYLDADTNNCRNSIGFRFDDGFASAFDSFAISRGPVPDGLTDVATGMPFLIHNGVKNYTAIPKFGTTQAPRTVLGISQDRKTAYFVVTQGRDVPAGAAGYRTNGVLVDIVANLGAWDAVNLDGGGSSMLWIGKEGGIQNQPTDGAERLVCCHLGVVPAPPAPDGAPDGLPDAGANDANGFDDGNADSGMSAGCACGAGGAADPTGALLVVLLLGLRPARKGTKS